jgi:hypothetical protein
LNDPAQDTGSGRGAISAPWRSFASVCLRLVEKFALPIALVLAPLLYQGQVAKQAQEEQKFQLYTNLLSKREEADSAVRMGLFDKLIGTYLERSPGDPGKKLVQLEMLALNFHDALNLNPLFWELGRAIDRMPRGPGRVELVERLDRVAEQVKARQAEMLSIDAFRRMIPVNLTLVDDGSGTQSFPTKPWSDDFEAPFINAAGRQEPHKTCQFKLIVSQKDAKERRVWVEVQPSNCEHKTIGFWVDLYDFPLTNFSRISRTERVAVTLHSYDEDRRFAVLEFLYFPSSRSAAKDKPYVDDLLTRLRAPDAAEAAVPGASAARR